MYLRLCYIIYVVGVLSCMFFFFKQKTAYDMRISDWSSDVCSIHVCFPRTHLALPRKRHSKIFTNVSATHCPSDSDLPHPSGEHGISRLRKRVNNFLRMSTLDRKSVVEGKSVSVRVVLGGGRIITEKKD